MPGNAGPSATTIPLVTTPIVVHDGQTLMYEGGQPHPTRHFRVSPDAGQLVTAVNRGQCMVLDERARAFLHSLPFIGWYDDGGALTDLDGAILDCSLGSPSQWAETVYERDWARGRRTLLVSFRLRRVALAGRELPVPAPWTKRLFVHLARAMIARANPRRIMVIGHELGARLFDLLTPDRCWMIETGFAEAAAVYRAMDGVLRERVLDELLFREEAFPWDNLAQALATALAVRRARNAVWSESLADRLRVMVPDALVTFVPPSIDLERFDGRARVRMEPLRILSGTGAHTVGPNGLAFLGIEALVRVVAGLQGCTLTLVTDDPTRVRETIGPVGSSVSIVPRVDREEMASAYATHDVYARLQDDASIPLSCVEAMAAGMVVLLNERTATTFRALRTGENVVHLPYGDDRALLEALRRLRDDRQSVAAIGRAAGATARTHCSLSAVLDRIGWSG